MSDQFDYVETYLQSRIRNSSTYRGVHLQQHNRLPPHKLDVILQAIFDTVGSSSFVEPSGDDPEPRRSHKVGHPWRYPNGNTPDDCRDYWTILDRIAASNVKGVSASFNSLKKNHFPNLESMGFLGRTEASDESRKYAQLTSAALSYLQSSGRDKIKMFAAASERPLVPLFEKLEPLLDRFGVISIFEMMLFISDFSLGADELETLIYNYKRLKQIEKLELHEAIQREMSRRMGEAIPKKDKLDWHNWLNQSQQIVDHLQFVTGFSVYQHEIIMRSGQAIAAIFTPKRSQRVKVEALAWHSLTSSEGWELHHVLPIDYATSEPELNLIDAKENLLYVPREVHRKFPTRSNRIVKLERTENALRVHNPASRDGLPEITLEIGRHVRLDVSNIPAMIRYNQHLLGSIT